MTFFRIVVQPKVIFPNRRIAEHHFSLHMHAKPSFAHHLQTAKMASSHTSAQNNGPRVQNNRSWVKRVLLERKMLDTRSLWL